MKYYDVTYEIVNLKTRKTEKRIFVSGIDYKSALAIKRNHKKICAMRVKRSAQQ